MKSNIDKIISSAPPWIIGVYNKVTPGEKTKTSIDIEGRDIAPDELKKLIEAADLAHDEDITINVIWNNQDSPRKV
jgi:hypothetical protein